MRDQRREVVQQVSVRGLWMWGWRRRLPGKERQNVGERADGASGKEQTDGRASCW